MPKLLIFLVIVAGWVAQAAERPNIVWIVGEDLGPELGCYGDEYASTPELDQLAAEGALFRRAFTHAPVCAPSRSGLITGRYPTSIGTHHMRSRLLKPPRTFTSYLREAGYHVAWPGKTDFNFEVPPDAFDSREEWLKHPPKQPFFAYINFGQSHESRIRQPRNAFRKATQGLGPGQRHDPAEAALPPYYPDTPAVRQDWASYHDLVSVVDQKVGQVLRQLEEQGLKENTVVFFFGDHGRGLPRGKRWVYDSGIHVPLIVRWPGKIKAGSIREDLVCFLDFAPTVLSLAGIEPPEEMDGRIFLGTEREPEPPYIFAARDRMDETYDRIRAVRDRRYKYIRNFHPELPYAQRISYMEEMPTMQEWRRLHRAGELEGAQQLFFAETKPREELYDTEQDPHEIRNLAADPAYGAKLKQMRQALDEWMHETDDLGEIPEQELIRGGLVADKLSEYEQRKETEPR